jgi:RNA polymerase sigma-70 factor (ECF subfamily)
MNYLRKQKNEQKYRDFFLHHLSPESSSLETNESYPLTSIIDRELEKEMHEVIESLPEKCRIIFKMSRFDEKSHEEIANEINVTVNTVKTQIVRALNKIREKFDFIKK